MLRSCLALVALLAPLAVLGCGSNNVPPGTGGGASTSVSTASVGGAGGQGGQGGGTAGGCPSCDPPGTVGNLASPEIAEASGIALSTRHAGAIYLHNDSDDEGRFFAVGPTGEDRGSYVLEGADAFDWEDMARGPCAGGGSCLYIADFGDNDRVRAQYVIHRVAEPDRLAPGERAVPYESFRYEYPGGAQNAEALLVHPTTGQVLVVTKDAEASRVYALPMPLDASRVVTAELVGEAEVPDLLPLVTGGAVAPDGSGVLLRTYTSLWFYAVEPGEGIATALARPPCSLPVAGEQQGEAVAWALDGKGYVTVSEGAGAAIHVTACR
jgi:hypothetical protein